MTELGPAEYILLRVSDDDGEEAERAAIANARVIRRLSPCPGCGADIEEERLDEDGLVRIVVDHDLGCELDLDEPRWLLDEDEPEIQGVT